MAYSLTLSRDEIRAFYFVGHRYGNGTEMLRLIESESDLLEAEEQQFKISESTAWKIKELAEQDELLFPLFSKALKEKMLAFIDSIV